MLPLHRRADPGLPYIARGILNRLRCTALLDERYEAVKGERSVSKRVSASREDSSMER
jgi:hypothetical protein